LFSFFGGKKKSEVFPVFLPRFFNSRLFLPLLNPSLGLIPQQSV